MPQIITAPLDADRTLAIEWADDHASRASASGLIDRRYAWRGYGRVGLPVAAGDVVRTTLTARADGVTLGTLTVALDAGGALAAEASFPEQVKALRRQGRRLAEFTRLAVDAGDDSDRVLAALFHVAHSLAHRVHDRDLLLIEVHPRHVRYYGRMLGATALGSTRRHGAVDAPAVLMTVELRQVQAHIARAAAQPVRRRSVFAWVFGRDQEMRIVTALRSLSAALLARHPAAAA